MTNVLLGITFVIVAVAVTVWRAFERARDISDGPDRARVTPESPALAIRYGVGDLRGAGLRGDGSMAEHGSGGAGDADGEHR